VKSMEIHKCRYCEKEYKNKYLLIRHVKSSVRCIKSRGASVEDSSTHACPCGYSTPRIDNLIRHQAGCFLVILRRTLAEHDIKLKDCERTIENLDRTIEDRDRTIEDRDRTITNYSKMMTKLEDQLKLLTPRPIVDDNLSGEVIIDNEPTSTVVHHTAFRDKIAIDLRPHDKKDVLYFGIFEASDDIELERELSADAMFCKFGVSSDITMRNGSHESGNQFPKFRIVHVVEAGCRNVASVAEKHVKRVVTQMGLRINYGKSKECFMANEDQLREVVTRADKFTQEDVPGITLEMRRLDLEAKKIDEKKIEIESRLIGLFSEGKLTYEQMREMLKK
jgi:hypothetical protein